MARKSLPIGDYTKYMSGRNRIQNVVESLDGRSAEIYYWDNSGLKPEYKSKTVSKGGSRVVNLRGGAQPSGRIDEANRRADALEARSYRDVQEARRNLDGTRKDVFGKAKEYRNWAKGLIDDAFDPDTIAMNAELFTPKADEDTQAFIDYASSLVADPTSMLRRAVDGDYDLTQFNQGVVAPMMRMAKEQEKQIMEQYSGGDPYGKTGGSTALSGAGKVARSKFRSDLSSTIANLQYQERNKMFDRAFSGMQVLGQLGDFVDNRKYAKLGMDYAMNLAGQKGSAMASIGSSAIGMMGSLGSSSLSLAGNELSNATSVLNTALGGVYSLRGTGINASAGMRNTDVQSATSRDIASLQASTQKYIAGLEQSFAQSEANRNQMNINIDRAQSANTMSELKKMISQLG